MFVNPTALAVIKGSIVIQDSDERVPWQSGDTVKAVLKKT
jgi:hypothetical protein